MAKVNGHYNRPVGGVIQTGADGSCPWYNSDFCNKGCKVRAWCIHVPREKPDSKR